MTTAVAPAYKGYRCPAEIIAHAVWRYFCFSLSYRDAETGIAEGVPGKHCARHPWPTMRRRGMMIMARYHRRVPAYSTQEEDHDDARGE